MLAGATLSITGCGASGAAAPGATGATGAPAPGSTATAPARPDEPTGTATMPPDPLATDVPVLKRTGASKTRVPATSAPFTKAVTYRDGVSLRIVSVKQAKTTGKGPGVFVGAPLTQFDVELKNGTTSDLKLDQVVVSLLYGSPQRVAQAVYEDGAVDLSGVVGAGKTVTARYLFSVPTAKLSAVSMTIDFAGTHAAATFKGSVK